MTQNNGKIESAPGRVFISYSRTDAAIAAHICSAMIAAGFETSLDLHDVKPGEPWKERLSSLIRAADKVVFLISPHSISSEICDWEVNEAERHAKTILPVVIRETDVDLIPGRLTRLHFINARDEIELPKAKTALIDALSVDLAWEREKTRIDDQAFVWAQKGRPRRLLIARDDAIRIAENWRDRHPATSQPPTEIHLQFIAASRTAYGARQRRILLGALVVTAVTGGLGVVAAIQRETAVENERLAEFEAERANAEAERAETEAGGANRQAARANVEAQRAERQAERANQEAERTRAALIISMNESTKLVGSLSTAARSGDIRKNRAIPLLEQLETSIWRMAEHQLYDAVEETQIRVAVQNIAAAFFHLGQKQRSLETIERLMEYQRRQVQSDPNDPLRRSTLAATLLRLSSERAANADVPGQLAALRDSVKLFRELSNGVPPLRENRKGAPPPYEFRALVIANFARALSVLIAVGRQHGESPDASVVEDAQRKLKEALDDPRVKNFRDYVTNAAREARPQFEWVLSQR